MGLWHWVVGNKRPSGCCVLIRAPFRDLEYRVVQLCWPVSMATRRGFSTGFSTWTWRCWGIDWLLNRPQLQPLSRRKQRAFSLISPSVLPPNTPPPSQQLLLPSSSSSSASSLVHSHHHAAMKRASPLLYSSPSPSSLTCSWWRPSRASKTAFSIAAMSRRFISTLLYPKRVEDQQVKTVVRYQVPWTFGGWEGFFCLF